MDDTDGKPTRSGRRLDLRGRSLRVHAARGTLLNSAFMVGLSLIGFIRGFVLAGLISREDYGLWGIVAVTLGTLLWLRSVGIGDRYVQQEDEDQELAFQKAFTLQLYVSFISMALLLAALPGVVAIYDQPRLVGPSLLLIAALPAAAFQAPLWIYYRQMQFGRQRVLQAIDPLIGTLITIGLAIAGAGYWSIAIGLITGAWLGALACVLTSPFKLRLRYDRGTLKHYWTFSWPLFVTALGAMVIAQSSFIATNAELGLAGAGAVALAASISQFTDRVDQVVTGTLYPAICAVRDDRGLLFESFVKSNRLALIWAVPFGVALALFSSDLVTYALGEQWRAAAVLLQVWGLVAAFGHIGFNWDAYFRARGETRPLAIASILTALAFVMLGLPLLFEFGLRGFAAAVGVQMLVNVGIRSFYLRRLFDGFVFFRHALRAIWPTVPAAATVLLLRVAESGDRHLRYALFEGVVYVAVTCVVTWRAERTLLTEVVGYVRGRPAAVAST